MFLQLCALVVVIVVYVLANYNVKEYIRTNVLLLKLPSVITDSWLSKIPLIGVTFKIGVLQPEEFFSFLKSLLNYDVPVVRTWLAGMPVASILDPNELDLLMGSSAHIKKGQQYDTLKVWLQEGLLTSSGQKWHERRKILTPAFHFKILEDCLPVMNRNSKIMASKIFQTCGDEAYSPIKFITLNTLDIISEAAMGVKLNAQNDGSSEYISDITRFNTSILLYIFYIIKERKSAYLKEKEVGTLKDSKRKAFLDCLIDVEMKNPGTLSDLDMREEVDTFMFEGHDTTSMAIYFAFMLLGAPQHADVQEKLAKEMYEVFGDSDRDVTFKDLQNMPYMENVIKEVLRITPSVPLFFRTLTQDLHLRCGMVIPRGTNMMLSPPFFQHHEKFFPDPFTLRPERFTQEESKGRNPYLYTPFSAGPRNCIGQKFAMMELKTVLSTVIRKVKIETITKYPEEVQFVPLIILRPKDPVLMKFSPRVY